jgi:hypothetical protein
VGPRKNFRGCRRSSRSALRRRHPCRPKYGSVTGFLPFVIVLSTVARVAMAKVIYQAL